VSGLRIRGGGTLSFGWDESGNIQELKAEGGENIIFVDGQGREVESK